MAELGEAGWLLQPASGPAEPMSAAAAGDAQFRLFEAVARCLGRLAAGRPVLVVLDDLHWADEPSLRLLGFLARALAAEPVALLGAYRDTEASRSCTSWPGRPSNSPWPASPGRGRGAGPGAGRDERFRPRSPRDVAAQRRQPVLRQGADRLLVAQGSWHQPAQIPASVAETLRRRLARLSTECVRLLEWAAVAGRDIDVGLLAHGAAAGHEAAALSLLDEARRAGVVAGTSPPRFTHDLYRETILDGLSTRPGPRSTCRSAGRCRRDRVRPRGSPRTCWPRARRRGRTRWSTRSSRPGRPPRASDTRTPARTTCGRWTSSPNAARPAPAPGSASRSCSSSPRARAHRAL